MAQFGILNGLMALAGKANSANLPADGSNEQTVLKQTIRMAGGRLFASVSRNSGPFEPNRAIESSTSLSSPSSSADDHKLPMANSLTTTSIINNNLQPFTSNLPDQNNHNHKNNHLAANRNNHHTTINDYDDNYGQSWHYEHYHKPYGPKMAKLPLFTDYDDVDHDLDADSGGQHQTQPQSEPQSIDLASSINLHQTTTRIGANFTKNHLDSRAANQTGNAGAIFETKILLNFTSPIAQRLLKLMQLKLLHKSNHLDNRLAAPPARLPVIQPITTTNLLQNPYLTFLTSSMTATTAANHAANQIAPPILPGYPSSSWSSSSSSSSSSLSPMSFQITNNNPPHLEPEPELKLKPIKLITNGTTNWDHLAQLSCDSGEMIVKLNFIEPFKGIVYPDHNRLSPCRFFGDGHHNYELRLPLRGCGTRQLAPRVFVNDVVVRFHKSLELEEDEVKTLICRYPAPLAPPSGSFNLNSPFDQNQPDQFEFIEPGLTTSSQPDKHKNSQTQIETLSENLIVASPPLIGPNRTRTHPDISSPNSNNRLPNLNDQNPINSLNDPLWQMINSNNSSSSPGQVHHNQRNLPLVDQATNTKLTAGGRPADLAPNGSLLLPSSTTTNNLQHRLPVHRPHGPLELLLLISSLMFLVLLIMAFVTSYYCLQRRRRRLLTSRTGGALATNGLMASSGGGQFIQTAPSTSSSSLAGVDYSNYKQPTTGSSRKRQPRDYNPYQIPNPILNTFWASSNNMHRGSSRADLAKLHEHPDEQLVGHIGPAGIKSISGLNRMSRWSNEGQLNIKGAQLRGESQFVSNARAHPAVPQRPPRQVLAGPMDQPVQYALVEPRHLRANKSTIEQQASWHQFVGETSSPSDIGADLCDNSTLYNRRQRPLTGSELNHPSTHDDQQQLWRSGSYASLSRYKHPGQQQQHSFAANHAHLSKTGYRQSNLRKIPMNFELNKHSGGSGNKLKRSQKEPETFEYWHHNQLLLKHSQDYQQLSRANSLGQQGARKNPIDRSMDNESPDSDDRFSSPGGHATGFGQSASSADRAMAPLPPRLVVKSIEDSYIKRYTEIEEKEYLQRDNRQSLSLADWRALTNRANQVTSNVKRTGPAAGSGYQQRTSKPEASDDDDDSNYSWLDMSRQDTNIRSERNLQNQMANQMRSLSEIDISFARPSNSNGVSNIQPETSTKQNKEEQQKQQQQQQQEAKINLIDNHQNRENIFNITPDLIISPEYKVDEDPYNRVRQLQLRSNERDHNKRSTTSQAGPRPDGSARPETPANSVSYV